MAPTDGSRTMETTRGRALAGLYAMVVVYTAAVLFYARGYRPDTALFPTVVGGAVFVGLCARFGTYVLGTEGGLTDEFHPELVDEPRPRAALTVFVWVALLVVSIAGLGLLPATTAVAAAFVAVYTRDARSAIATAVVVFLLGYVLFGVVLEAGSYGGLLAEWAGVRLFA